VAKQSHGSQPQLAYKGEERMIKVEITTDRVHAKIQRLVLDTPLTEADYDDDGKLTKKATKRVQTAVWQQLTAQDLEACAQAAFCDMVELVLETHVRLGAKQRYVGDDGEIHYRKLRDLTPDEEREVENVIDVAMAGR
jgi:hypothetical protein